MMAISSTNFTTYSVIPAKAGIHFNQLLNWIPAFARMTRLWVFRIENNSRKALNYFIKGLLISISAYCIPVNFLIARCWRLLGRPAPRSRTPVSLVLVSLAFSRLTILAGVSAYNKAASGAPRRILLNAIWVALHFLCSLLVFQFYLQFLYA